MHLDSRITEGNVVGPYLDKTSGRRLVTVYRADGTHGSMTYARWLMQEHLGRKLEPWEHVDHKDENRLNDVVENYQILTPDKNTQKSFYTNPEAHGKGIEKGWTHGTTYGWMKKKCSCGDCAAAKRIWHDRRNAKRRRSSASGGMADTRI